MPKNYSHRPASEELEQFLQTWKDRRFEEFGFDECTKKRTGFKVEMQGRILQQEGEFRRINLETSYCQPLAWWDGTSLQIGGVKDYHPDTQTGTFVHETKDGQLIVPDVHSYHVFVCVDGKFLPCRHNWQPEIEYLSNIYLSAIIKKDMGFEWRLYRNTELLLSEENVHEYEYLSDFEKAPYKSRHGYVIFSRIRGDVFENILCDVETQQYFMLDPSKGSPSWSCYDRSGSRSASWGIQTWWQRKELRERLTNENGMITVMLHLDNSKTAQVMAEYIKDADKVERVDNLFDEDATINFAVTYLNRWKSIKFLYYCMYKNPELFGHAVFGIGIDELERGTLNHYREYQNVYEYSEYQLSQMKKIILSLHEMCGEEMSPGSLPEVVYENCTSLYVVRLILDHCIGPVEGTTRWDDDRKVDFSEERNIFNDIFSGLAAKDNLSPKWKSEYMLFRTVHALYPDSVYQYHSDWLIRQSLDIFIPSLMLAIEYQGVQHYEPIEIFGGESALRNNQERDARKRSLCKQNGINLIEWKYDDPISTLVLKQKLIEAKVEESEVNLLIDRAVTSGLIKQPSIAKPKGRKIPKGEASQCALF